MLKKLLVMDGVMAVAKFRDDGAFVEGYGMMPDEQLVGLAKFAHEYKRMVQANADQLSMFSQVRGWTPPGGWIVRGPSLSVLSVSNLVVVVNSAESSINQVLDGLREAANY